MASFFPFEQLLFIEVDFSLISLLVKAVKPTLLNKSCSNQKNNATLLFQFQKFQKQKFKDFLYEQFLFSKIDTPLEKAKWALG